jgi:hypothetical protein
VVTEHSETDLRDLFRPERHAAHTPCPAGPVPAGPPHRREGGGALAVGKYAPGRPVPVRADCIRGNANAILDADSGFLDLERSISRRGGNGP